MPDTLSREELAAIRERDWLTEHNQAYEPGWSHSERDRRALLAHIDALTAAVEGLEVFDVVILDEPAGQMVRLDRVLAILGDEQ